MADNTTLASASGGDTIATDDIGGVKFPRTKIVIGSDGINSGDVASGNPLPVVLESAVSSISVVQSGSWTASILNVIPGTGATDLGKAIDSASGATDTGVAILAIRDDALTTLTPVDGDYVGLRVGSTGALWVGVTGTVTVDGSGVTQPVSHAALTELAAAINLNRVDVNIAAESAAVTVDAANDGTLTTRIGDGTNIATIRDLAANDALNVAIVDGSGDQIISFGGGTQYTEGDTDATIVGTALMMEGATNTLVPAQGTAADGLLVNLGTNNDVTGTVTANAGTNLNTSALALETGGNLATIAGDTTSLDSKVTACDTGAVVISSGSVTADLGANNDVQGAVAHDGAVSGNPFLQAGEARTSEGTAVANGDAVRLMADLVGKLVMQPFTVSDLFQDGQTTHTSTTANQELFASAGAGVRHFLTDISISNTSATDTEVIVKDATTEKYRFPAPANGGCVHRFGIPLRGTASNAINVSTVDAVSAVTVSATGYTGR